MILFEQEDANNKTQTYTTQVNKNGFIYTWQAKNGTLLAAEKVHPFVNWATSVDLKTGVPVKDARYSTHTGHDAKKICPSNFGAKGLAPAAYSPKTGLIYVPLILGCMNYEPTASKYVTRQPWVGAMTNHFPSAENGWGGFLALNPISSKVAWYNKENFSVSSGVLTTATNLLFYGTTNRWFKALDAKTGHELWEFQIGSGVVGNTFTYHIKGKQYVGVISGIGSILTDVFPRYIYGWSRGRGGLEGCGMAAITTGPAEPAYMEDGCGGIVGAGAINIFSL